MFWLRNKKIIFSLYTFIQRHVSVSYSMNNYVLTKAKSMLIVYMLLKTCSNMSALGPLNFKTVDLLITSIYCLAI